MTYPDAVLLYCCVAAEKKEVAEGEGTFDSGTYTFITLCQRNVKEYHGTLMRRVLYGWAEGLSLKSTGRPSTVRDTPKEGGVPSTKRGCL